MTNLGKSKLGEAYYCLHGSKQNLGLLEDAEEVLGKGHRRLRVGPFTQGVMDNLSCLLPAWKYSEMALGEGPECITSKLLYT